MAAVHSPIGGLVVASRRRACFWAHLEGRPQCAGGGDPPLHHLTFTDVHERVLAEQALRETQLLVPPDKRRDQALEFATGRRPENWAALDIKDLTGVEYATNLLNLNLKSNEITDIAPLANLTQLTDINLGENQIGNIAPLANLTNLRGLQLKYNRIADLTPLSGLTALQYLGPPLSTKSPTSRHWRACPV